MSGRGIPFVFDRLSEIRDQLHLYGFRLDPRPGTSYVDPTYAAEPRTGMVEVTAGLEADIERLQAQGLNTAADIVDSLDLEDYVP